MTYTINKRLSGGWKITVGNFISISFHVLLAAQYALVSMYVHASDICT